MLDLKLKKKDTSRGRALQNKILTIQLQIIPADENVESSKGTDVIPRGQPNELKFLKDSYKKIKRRLHMKEH